jgi:hypothetical protein
VSTATISESEFQEQVLELAHALGWKHLHVRPSIGQGHTWVTATNVPWPDLTLWRPTLGAARPLGPRSVEVPVGARFLVRELKVGDITKDATWQPGQREVLNELQRAGVHASVWTPDDFDTGRILTELGGRR